MNKDFQFDVGTLINKPVGTSEKFSFSYPLELEDINLKGDTTGFLEIMRIDEGFAVMVTDLKVRVNLICERCLKKYIQKISIDNIERIFLLDKPLRISDPNETFQVDKKSLKLNPSDMLRQEIILHFPINQVCFYRCKGICPGCGRDLNKEKCICKPKTSEVPEHQKPFAALKELIKPKNHGKTSGTKEKNR